MESYTEMKSKHEKEISDFPMFFAFSKDQFKEGMKKLELKSNETDKIYKLGGTGGFYRKTDSDKFDKLLKKQEDELERLKKNDIFLLNAITYELANHEYCITYDPTDTVETLGLDMKNKRVLKIFKEARQRYLNFANLEE